MQLRGSLLGLFPAQPYSGPVTLSDGEFTPESNDEESLFIALRGRKWTDIDRSFMYSQPGDFVLLTDPAYRAFLPAWLFCSLDSIGAENKVRDAVINSISHTAQGLRLFNANQRGTVRSLMEYFSRFDPSDFNRKQAVQALDHIERLERNLVLHPWLDKSHS